MHPSPTALPFKTPSPASHLFSSTLGLRRARLSTSSAMLSKASMADWWGSSISLSGAAAAQPPCASLKTVRFVQKKTTQPQNPSPPSTQLGSPHLPRGLQAEIPQVHDVGGIAVGRDADHLQAAGPQLRRAGSKGGRSTSLRSLHTMKCTSNQQSHNCFHSPIRFTPLHTNRPAWALPRRCTARREVAPRT